MEEVYICNFAKVDERYFFLLLIIGSISHLYQSDLNVNVHFMLRKENAMQYGSPEMGPESNERGGCDAG